MKIRPAIQALLSCIADKQIRHGAVSLYLILLEKGATNDLESYGRTYNIGRRQIYEYAQQLKSVGLLEISDREAYKSCTYKPVVPVLPFRKHSLVPSTPSSYRYRKGNKKSSLASGSSNGSSSSSLEENSGTEKDIQETAKSIALEVIAKLPEDERSGAAPAKKYFKPICRLNGEVEIPVYTAWFIEYKLEAESKTFNWGFFCSPHLVKEYKKGEKERERQYYDKHITERWVKRALTIRREHEERGEPVPNPVKKYLEKRGLW